jgi:drug/metabolite transporter (DMT)-like permease
LWAADKESEPKTNKLRGFYRTVTLTRKLFTMLLSVVLYNHQLNPGQWGGAALVFAGISVEAWIKRRGKISRNNPN